MDGQINRLTSLINDLLDVTKIEGGKLRFHNALFDLNNLIREVVEENKHMTERHSIKFKLGKIRKIYGDRDRVGQVLTNYITNAIKYSPLADKIIVTSSIRGTTSGSKRPGFWTWNPSRQNRKSI
jgi:signal transduction histidine kinase